MADAYKEVTKYGEEPELVEAETIAETEPEEVKDLSEIAPPGWEGTVKAMKKHKDIDNPYALSWHMKKKGFKSHKKEEVEIDELSNTTLGSYKAKSAAQASAADKKGNFKKADKRFSGITRATNKQFANDAKKEGTEGEALVKAVANSPKQQALKKKQAAQDAYQKNIDYDTARHAAKTRKHEMWNWMKATIDELAKKTLPPHLSKFLDKKGNPNPEAAKRMADGKNKRAVTAKVKDVTPKGYGPNEEVEVEMEGNVKSKKEWMPWAGKHIGDKPRQLKDPKKEKMVGTKSGTKVVDRNDPKYKKHPEHEALDLKQIRQQNRIRGLKNLKKSKLGALARTLDKQQSATDGHGGYAPNDGGPAHPSPKGAVKSDGPPGRPRGGKYKIHTKRIAKRYKDAATAAKGKKSSSVSDSDKVSASKALLTKLNTKKEALDTWHPDPAKDRKSTSMKHTAKAVRQHARRDKPAPVARKKVTPDQIRDILDKQRVRKAAQNEEVQFKVKIRDLPPFYVPGKSAGAVKSALRKQLRKPDDIESIERHTDSAKKKDLD